MKNKKGFTLIELLAVIVILAIIALIATPIVLGIIESSRESAKENSAQFIVDGVQTAYAVAYTKNYTEADGVAVKASGNVPALEHIKKEINFKNTKEPALSGDTLTITSNDDVVCEFKVTAGSLALTNHCGLGEEKIPNVNIGEVSGAATDPGQTDTTQTEPGA